MAASDRARLTAAAGRRFAFQVGGVFLVIGALLWWRARSSAPLFAGIGTLLVFAGRRITRPCDEANHACRHIFSGGHTGGLAAPAVRRVDTGAA